MGMIKRVYGRDGEHSTCYLTRVKLTPKTRWGRLYFHFFHRGDHDRDFHDHPYDFWTFPLVTYYENVLDLVSGRVTRNAVTAFHRHFRPAEYTHIQLGAARYEWIEQTLVSRGGYKKVNRIRRENVFGGWTATFVWHRPTRRKWGFWVKPERPVFFGRYGPRYWVPWRDYVYP